MTLGLFTDFFSSYSWPTHPYFSSGLRTRILYAKQNIQKTRNSSKAKMTSLTGAEMLAASMAAELPQPHIRRPSTFLSLAPTTSASYPQQRTSPPASIVSPKIVAADIAATTTTESAAAVTETAPLATVEELDGSGVPKHRRTSSLASDDSGNAKLRFLKLGPVHWGEGDGKGDWSEVGVAE